MAVPLILRISQICFIFITLLITEMTFFTRSYTTRPQLVLALIPVYAALFFSLYRPRSFFPFTFFLTITQINQDRYLVCLRHRLYILIGHIPDTVTIAQGGANIKINNMFNGSYEITLGSGTIVKSLAMASKEDAIELYKLGFGTKYTERWEQLVFNPISLASASLEVASTLQHDLNILASHLLASLIDTQSTVFKMAFLGSVPALAALTMVYNAFQNR